MEHLLVILSWTGTAVHSIKNNNNKQTNKQKTQNVKYCLSIQRLTLRIKVIVIATIYVSFRDTSTQQLQPHCFQLEL